MAHGIAHAPAGGIVAMGLGDVCPPSSSLLAFEKDDGSVARMAVVRAANVAASVPAPLSARSRPSNIGRYIVGPKIAAGGMAAVHLGRLRGPAGFARTVAIKRLLPELASDPEFVARFVDEARIASRVRHANVVPTIDVVDAPEVLLVLEYVHGESLARLLRIAASRGERCPPSVASAIVIGILRGLHGAHEAKGSNGIPLELVHRDVSPQNVLVGADGAPRMLDFGIAKAAGREQSTIARGKGSPHDIRGKLAYMAPEQVSGEPIDRRADLFAAGVMLWETLASERLFRGEDAMTTMEAIFHREPPPLHKRIPELSPRVDDALAQALAKDASHRFATADEMARAIEAALPPGSDREVADWVERIAAEILSARAAIIARFEGSTDSGEEDAIDVPDPTTQKRSAFFPPKMRDEAKTSPDFDPAMIGGPPPAAAIPVPVPAHEPLRTPLSMVTPAMDPLANTGMSSTRVEPLDMEALEARRRVSKSGPPRTPIPMPMPVAKKKLSPVRIATLIITPPAIAALVILFMHPAPTASAANEPPAAPTTEVALPLPSPVPPIVNATPPPLAAKVIEPTPHPTSAPAAAGSAAAAKAPRARPWPRIPRKR